MGNFQFFFLSLIESLEVDFTFSECFVTYPFRVKCGLISNKGFIFLDNWWTNVGLFYTWV